MSLCETPLPDACGQELQRLIAEVPDADLSRLVATEPAFRVGGFRPTGKPAVLRARLRQIVTGAGPLPESVRRILARRSRAAALLNLLSPELLAELRHALASLLGDPALRIAMLLDDRVEVRDQAEAWLREADPLPPLKPDQALDRLREQFAPLTDLIGIAPAANQPPTREAWLTQKARMEERLRCLQTEKRRLQGVEDRLARQATLLKKSEAELDLARQKAEAAEASLRRNTVELETARAELARETDRRDERLAAALDLALAREFHGWLAHTREVETEARETDRHADLVAQAEAALQHQREQDRHSGNRAVLGMRAEQLRSVLEEVRDTLAHALRVTPELQRMESALASEVRRIEQILNPQPPTTPLEKALLAHLHAAPENDLPGLRDLPERFAPLGVLDDAALDRLREAFRKRLSVLQTAVPPPEPHMAERRGPVARLGRALAGEEPAILLIDGHNVLFGLPSRYAPPRGASLSEAEKRQRLIDDLTRLTSNTPSIRVWLVFDGPTRSDNQAAANVRVTYSGGEGEHRADGVLLDTLRFFKSSSPDTVVFLVSNDHDLCVAAQRLGAIDITVLELGPFF
ncbi:MAG TPA: NYN domain-containing protein [Kiritimatiellia bacterium]|nr:NYN domain-containing protein [Kiritimatiellia bacterium]